MTAMQLHPLPPNQVGRSQRGLWKEDRRSVGSELGRSGRHPPTHTTNSIRFLFMSPSLPYSHYTVQQMMKSYIKIHQSFLRLDLNSSLPFAHFTHFVEREALDLLSCYS